MENFIVYLPIFLALLLAIVLIGRYIFNCFADDKTEKQLASDKRKSDQLTASINISTAGLEESKKLSERIGTNQQSAKRTVTEATESVGTAKERSRTTVELTDECLAILEEAEKTSKQS